MRKEWTCGQVVMGLVSMGFMIYAGAHWPENDPAWRALWWALVAIWTEPKVRG